MPTAPSPPTVSQHSARAAAARHTRIIGGCGLAQATHDLARGVARPVAATAGRRAPRLAAGLHERAGLGSGCGSGLAAHLRGTAPRLYARWTRPQHFSRPASPGGARSGAGSPDPGIDGSDPVLLGLLEKSELEWRRKGRERGRYRAAASWPFWAPQRGAATAGRRVAAVAEEASAVGVPGGGSVGCRPSHLVRCGGLFGFESGSLF